MGARTTELSRRAADALWAFHGALTVFLAIAWALPWDAALWTAVFVYPSVALHWWLSGDRCVLTTLEQRLRERAQQGTQRRDRAPGATSTGSACPAAATAITDASAPPTFVARLLASLARRPIAEPCADRFSRAVVMAGFAVCVARLWLRHA